MPSSNKIDDATRDKVVEMYQAGAKTEEITAETGVIRPTQYFILQQRGIMPRRTRRTPPGVTVDQLLERLSAAEREIGRLRALLEVREAELNELAEEIDKPSRAAFERRGGVSCK